MRPIVEYEPMDRATFEREIVPKGEPAVFRGLVADWSVVRAGQAGPQSLAQMLRDAATDEPFQAWFGPPEIEGRFNYDAELSGFNFERKLATVDQLLELLLRQLGHEKPYSMYAGGIPIPKHLPSLVSAIPVNMLDMTRETLISAPSFLPNDRILYTVIMKGDAPSETRHQARHAVHTSGEAVAIAPGEHEHFDRAQSRHHRAVQEDAVVE